MYDHSKREVAERRIWRQTKTPVRVSPFDNRITAFLYSLNESLPTHCSTCTEKQTFAHLAGFWTVFRHSFAAMGIKGLSKLLGDNAPRCIKDKDLKALSGRKIAIDASMCIYQLLVGVRMGADNFTNDSGMNTSHIIGLFYRSIKLLELGIKPVYVFDGKPPPMKGGELRKRAELKAANIESHKKAQEAGDTEAMEKFSRRINTITPEMTDACKNLLRFMGIPVVEAPCEAEAQCAEMCKAGLVYATASEDMDSLTFGTTRLLRHLWAGTSSTAAKKGIKPAEYSLSVALEDLDMDMAKFIDMCMLCGCDYLDGIRGLGPVTALKLMREHGSMGDVLQVIKGNGKYTMPDEYPHDEARKLFCSPEVLSAKEIKLKWTGPDGEKLTNFLVKEHNFDESKVQSGIKRLEEARKATNQVRIDQFFKPKAAPNAGKLAAKRKAMIAEKGKKGKGKKAVSTPISKKARK